MFRKHYQFPLSTSALELLAAAVEADDTPAVALAPFPLLSGGRVLCGFNEHVKYVRCISIPIYYFLQ